MNPCTGHILAPSPLREVGRARCAVSDRVQRSERILNDLRITVPTAPLNAARTAQRALPTRWLCKQAIVRWSILATLCGLMSSAIAGNPPIGIEIGTRFFRLSIAATNGHCEL